MPVIRPAATPLDPEIRGRLVERLADELDREGVAGEPLVVETPIARTERIRVVVIWTEWESVPRAERNEMIQEAYRRRSARNPAAPQRQVASAIGVTPVEAVQLDLLPYAVEPAEPGNVDPAELSRAKAAAGAVRTPFGSLLRFASPQAARAALDRLQQSLPAAKWWMGESGSAADF